MLKEKVMNSVREILKEGNLLISQLEHFPLSSVRQVEMVCDRLKEKAGLSKRGSFSAETSPYPSGNKPVSKTDITKVHTVHGKILVGEKLANLANHEPFAKFFLANGFYLPKFSPPNISRI